MPSEFRSRTSWSRWRVAEMQSRSLFYAGLVALVVAVGFLGFGLIAGSGR